MSEINTPAAGGLTEGWTRTDRGKIRFMEILEEKRSCKTGKNIVSKSREEYEKTVQKLKAICSGQLKPSENDR